jgi:hypothetical protein
LEGLLIGASGGFALALAIIGNSSVTLWAGAELRTIGSITGFTIGGNDGYSEEYRIYQYWING